MTKRHIEITAVAPVLVELGFTDVRPHFLVADHRNKVHPRISVRAPRGQSYSGTVSSLIFEVDARGGNRGRRFAAAELTVRDASQLRAAFVKWLPGALAASARVDEENRARRERQEAANKAEKAYTALGFQSWNIIHGEHGTPCGVRIQVTINGSAEECLRKLNLIKEIK